MANSPTRRAKRNDLYWIQGGRCFWCDEPVPDGKATLDELKPLGRGGTDCWGNIVMACISCNHERGAKVAPKWALKEAVRLATIRTAAHMATRVVRGDPVLITMPSNP